MSSYVTIATDGSRDVDVQSLFEDQFELVRRIARMGQLSGFTELAIQIGRLSEFVEQLKSDKYSAQQRIAELDGERDRLRTLLADIKGWECNREIGDTLYVLPLELRQRIQQELENPDAD